MIGMPFSIASFSPVAKLGYQTMQEAYNSFGSIEEVNDNTKIEDVSLIVVDPQIIQQYVEFFDGKTSEIQEGLKGSLNKIETNSLQCRMQFGSENSKAAHSFLSESWGIRETSKKMWAYLTGKRVFLTDGLAPYKLAIASKSGRIDTGSNFFELDDVKRDLIMVFADLVTFLQVHTANSLDPKKLSEAKSDADISTMVNKSGTVYTFVSLDIVLLFMITNHLYNMLNMTHYLYQNGGLVYPTLYAHVDHLNEYVTSIAIPLLEQKQEKNLTERSESFRSATKHLVEVLGKSSNAHLKKISNVLGSVGDQQVEQVSYMNAAPSSSVASLLAKQSFSNISSSMTQVKSFVNDVAEQKGHYDQMQKLLAQNAKAIEASKQMMQENPNAKKWKFFGGNFGSTMLGGSDLGGKFKKAIPPFEVARLSQSYFQSILYKVESGAPTAMLKHIHESMPLMNYYYDLVRPIMRLLFSYNDISLNSTLLNTFIGHLYLKMFVYYDAFFEDVKGIEGNEDLTSVLGGGYKDDSIEITLSDNLDETQETNVYIITNVKFGDIEVNKTKILSLLFGMEETPDAYKIALSSAKTELSGYASETSKVKLDKFFDKFVDVEQIPVVKSWVDKVLTIKAMALDTKPKSKIVQSVKESVDEEAKGFGDDVSSLLKDETLREVQSHMKQSAKDLEQVIASCFPLEMPMLQFLFRKRTALSPKSLEITGVTPFYLLLDYTYSMCVHSFVSHYAKDSVEKANQAVKKHLYRKGDTGTSETVNSKLKSLIANYIKRYQKCFKTSELDVLEDDRRDEVITAIASSSKDAMLPVLALSLATLISVFERLVLLDIAKRSASSMIKQYGSMVFHKPKFTAQLEKLYQDEEKLGQVLEAVIYQLLPELERYAESIDSNYWLESLKKVYVDVKPRLMVLSNTLQKHGNMAATYVKKAKMYLHDEEKVKIKQQAYLTLLTNINHYLNQQIQAAPYSQAGKEFDYGAFVNSAIITKETMASNVQKEKEALEEQVAEICQRNGYPLETKMFFYSMLRGGMWTLFSTHPTPLRDFLLSSVDTKFLMCAYLTDEGQSSLMSSQNQYTTPAQLFMDVNKELVLGYRPDYMMDWLLLESAQDSRKGVFTVSDFNKMVIWLHFLDERVNPLRASLQMQIEQIKALFDSFKLQPKAIKKTIVAILVYSILQAEFLYNKIKPLTGALQEGMDADAAYNQIIDNISGSFSYDEADMPGPMYFILFGLYTVTDAKEDFTEAFAEKFKEVAFKALDEDDTAPDEVEFIKTLVTDCDGSKLKTVKQQIELTVPVLQESIHNAFASLEGIFSDTSAQTTVASMIKAHASRSVTSLQKRLATSSIYTYSKNVVKVLTASQIMLKKSTGSASGRLASYFEFVPKQVSTQAPIFVTKNQFGWSSDRFGSSDYVPINRASNSASYSSNFLKTDVSSTVASKRIEKLDMALDVLSYPALYTLIVQETAKLVENIGTKSIEGTIPPHTSCITVAVSIVMMAYLAKTSYIFDTNPEIDGQTLSESLKVVSNYKLRQFSQLDTEYTSPYIQLYEIFKSDFVCPFELIGPSQSQAPKSAHQTAINRLLNKEEYISAAETKGKGVFLTDRIANSDGLNWFTKELKGVDLYESKALLQRYHLIDLELHETKSDRLYRLKKYFHDFNAALS